MLEVDNSDNGSSHGAVYKGATSGEINGIEIICTSPNFRSGRVEVAVTSTFKRVHLGDDAFRLDGDCDRDDHDGNHNDCDRDRDGYAPFNIQNIGGSLLRHLRQTGRPETHRYSRHRTWFRGDLFSPMRGRQYSADLEHGDWFNAPWGVVWTTRDFGEFSNSILRRKFRAVDGSRHLMGLPTNSKGFLQNPDNSPVNY